ncbi:hypothetical protein [Prevotella intermedia]|uniref:hypothetical protein n=1 Tax=Prevotella intermedia TaxID=28131 RepID=UPI00048F7F76|nr:hypothetical protein [Prevotella intermedia]
MIWVGAWLIALLAPKEKKVYIVFLAFLEFLGFLKQHLEIPCFCKETSTEKRHFRFGITKAAVLHGKTYAFTVQNSRFGNVKQ